MNLQEICLEIIVEKFHMYYALFSESDDMNFKRKFEFLQRVYSYEIITRLKESDILKMEYIDFLINKYLKILSAEWFKDCSWNIVVSKFAEIGSNIRNVYLSFEDDCIQACLPWKDVIHHLTNLEVFHFPYGCTDEILNSVAKSNPNIVEIDVSHSNVTTDGIKQLCKKECGKAMCPKLKKLMIGTSQVDEEGMKYLIQNLKSLQVTDYYKLPEILYLIHEKDMLTLSKIEPYNLTTLDLLPVYYLPHYNDMLKLCLFVCPLLKSFSFYISNKEQLDLFLSSPLKLENLLLESSSETDIDVTDLLRKKGQKLMSLIVTMCTLSVAVLAESCLDLKHLFLSQVFFKDDNPSSLFRCLETCIFNFNRYDSATAKSISLLLETSPKLEYIGFKMCDISSRELKTEILRCCEHCPIKKISFAGSIVDTEFIKDILLSCHSLKSFHLDNVSNRDKLELYSLAEVLPNNPVIEFLDDEVNMIEDSDDEDNDDDISYGFDFNDFYDNYYNDYYHYNSNKDFYDPYFHP